MIDVNTLKAIIPFLRSSGVSRFKTGDLEVDFCTNVPHNDVGESLPQVPASLNETKVDPIETAKATAKLEEQLPVDLRSENINKFDNILNWSAGPDLAEANNPGETMPATADVPLSGQS